MRLFPRAPETIAALLLFLLGAGASRGLHAMPPPPPGALETYRKDGSLPERQRFARAKGNHRVDPVRLHEADLRLRALASRAGVRVPQAKGLAFTPPPAWQGMPSKGNVKVLILCIDFSDFPHDDARNSIPQVRSRIFGDGSGGGPAPYESLARFYSRSSYGQLTLDGDVLGWYRPAATRESIAQTDTGRQELIQEALQHYDDLGYDFSPYDNNGDGVIDYFAVIWSGPDNGWANFWWGYQTAWDNAPGSLTLDGKTLGKYSWQWESKQGYTWSYPFFDPGVLIHETGHALGLPDYYDYDPSKGPGGGVGGLDQMDANWGDQNCFSKFLLDWITPQVVTSTRRGLSLQSSGVHGDALIIMDVDPGGCFGEYFMVQNRSRTGNDVDHPGEGLLVWHVDAQLRPSGEDFRFDNSWTEHKLLRLMEADGMEQIEQGLKADAGDYYSSGRTFGPATLPGSGRYDFRPSAMGIDNLSSPGPTMTLDVSRLMDPTPPAGQPSRPVCSIDAAGLGILWSAGSTSDPESGLATYRLQLGSAPGASDLLDCYPGTAIQYTVSDLASLEGGNIYARVAAVNGAAAQGAWSETSDPVAFSLPGFDAAILDCSNLLFKSSGAWREETGVSYVGGSCAYHDGSPYALDVIQTRVTGPGIISFDWRFDIIDLLNWQDTLSFTIDGQDEGLPIGGNQPWNTRVHAVPSGSHLLRWSYKGGGSSTAGHGSGRLDNVRWTNGGRVMAGVAPSRYVAVPGATIPYRAFVSNATADNRVDWSVSSNAGTFLPVRTSSNAFTRFTAGGFIGSYTVTATPLESGGVAGNATLVLVDPSTVAVSCQPQERAVGYGQTVRFTGSVSGITDTALRWEVVSGGGSVDGNGWYRAPSRPVDGSPTGSATIRATSIGAPMCFNDATVMLMDWSQSGLVITPSECTMLPGQVQRLTITGDQGQGFHWGSWDDTVVLVTTDGYVIIPKYAPLSDRTITLTAVSNLSAAMQAKCIIHVRSMDMDCNQRLDLRDALLLAAEWGRDVDSRANFKGYGTVDSEDLEALLRTIDFTLP